MHEAGQIAVTELHRRKVHADLQRGCPGCRLAAGFAQRPCADLDDHAVLLGERDELAWRDDAEPRVAPARQGLEPEYLAVDRGLRLIVEEQLVACDGRAQIELQREALAQAAIHLGIEEAGRMAAIDLGAVERGIGIGEQRRHLGAVARIDCGSDAEAKRDLLPAHLEGVCHRL